MNTTFTIDRRFKKVIQDFMAEHENCKSDALGGKFEYTFMPDVYGLCITITCTTCGDELNLIEYYDREMVGNFEETDTLIYTDEKEEMKTTDADLTFTLNDESEKELNEYYSKHDNCPRNATGGKYIYTFYPDFCSMRIFVNCYRCDDTLDILEYLEPFTDSPYIKD